MAKTSPVLIADQWRDADASGSFQAVNPKTREPLPELFPVSTWQDCDAALTAAAAAFEQLSQLPGERLAEFLEAYAQQIDANDEAIKQLAALETGYPLEPRLKGEMARTTDQLRQAAAAARTGSWRMATIDTKAAARSYYGALGPVCVFGPNNFPLAFGSLSGGDFAAAIAAGNPVIAKANSSHPGTTRLFAEAALAAAQGTGMPAGTVQLIYRTSHDDGERLVSDPRVGATGYTGSRSAGLALKAAADKAGKPIYLELSSVNPVVILPGVIKQRLGEIADEFAGSCLMGTGQFCTNPGLILLIRGVESDSLISEMVKRFAAAPVGTLLSEGVERSLARNLTTLRQAGAEQLIGGEAGAGTGFSHANTLLKITAEQFLLDPELMQTEAFGNASLLVIADDVEQAGSVLAKLEGNLTGCIYSDTTGDDEHAYEQLAPVLRQKVGRLINDKMPTGVAVSPAMNHGGPYPATGHPGFTAVGIPAAMLRFGMLQCYDSVRPHRLPAALQDKNPNGQMWRLIDGAWTQADVGG